MTDEQDSPAEAPRCSICNAPMIEGQAFHGIRQSHWDCAQRVPRDPVPTCFPSVHPAQGMPVPPTIVEDAAGAVRPVPRSPERGPTSADVRMAAMSENARQVESRRWMQAWRQPENGRTSIGLECPFCFEVVKAYVWSLPNGKRCSCGAFHGRFLSTHWRQADNSLNATH
ncbi:hypothetical protein [Pseudomonas sp. 460]|uniref:hypothetical protein n=1 Tax=Pseudomonas sp. 460 TaxID=2485142 RepID=UPI0010D422A8|nr:hypothetical protein [Pseudomonas sp. 460]TCV51436.1 hypothetical protein EDB99_107102 [Pseudomonas sp. 460]